jgi:hypothetical protein
MTAVALAISGVFLTGLVSAWDKPVLRDALLAGLINSFEIFVAAGAATSLSYSYTIRRLLRSKEPDPHDPRPLLFDVAMALVISAGLFWAGARFVWVLTEPAVLTVLDCKIMQRERLINSSSIGKDEMPLDIVGRCANPKRQLW